MFDKEKFTDIVSKFVTMSGKILPDDVTKKLEELKKRRNRRTGKNRV